MNNWLRRKLYLFEYFGSLSPAINSKHNVNFIFNLWKPNKMNKTAIGLDKKNALIQMIS